MNREERIAEILVEFFEHGPERDPEELVREYPEFTRELRSHIRAMQAVDAALLPPALPEGTPKRIGEYDIVRELGRGGMGVVYEAVQRSMERPVALKVLSLSFTSTPQAVQRFRREAKAAGRIHHTNIVPVYGLGQIAGYSYYAMELVDGRPLSAVIRELKAQRQSGEETLARLLTDTASAGRRTPITGTGARAYHARIADMFSGVADALAAAHRERIVHRDLKPSNLLFVADGTLKIVDFGLARTPEQGPSLTGTGDILGTPLYMSPEQAAAKRTDVDHRTDIYSLGATLYEVLTLRPPFAGVTVQAIWAQIIGREPPLPRRINPRIPRDLETIVLKAMEKDRQRRYQSAGALARDLRRFALGEPIGAKRIGRLERTWRTVKRHRAISALAVATLALIATGGMLAHHAMVESGRRRNVEYAMLLEQAEELMASRRAFTQEDTLASTMADLPARELLTRAIELLPDRPTAYWLRALADGRVPEERWRDLEAAGALGLPLRTYHVTRAHLLENEHRWDAAEQARARAAAESPTAESDYFEAKILHEGGRRAEALALLNRSVGTGARGDFLRFLAHRLRARVYGDLRDYAAALKDLHALQEIGHDSLAVRISIAANWRLLEQEDVATREFEAAVAGVRRDGRPATWQELCLACRSAEQSDWHGGVTEEALAAHPEDEQILRERVLRLRLDGRLEEAASLCGKALALHPESHALTGESARIHASRGAHDVALGLFDRALASKPDCYHCLIGRGSLLNDMQRYDDVLENCRRAIAVQPRSSVAYYNMAQTYRTMNRIEDAQRTYRDAIRVDASSQDALNNLAVLLTDENQYDEAMQLINRAIELGPRDPSRWVNRSNIHVGAGRHEEAEADLRRALAIDPDFASALNNLGALYLNVYDKPKEAIPHFLRAAQLLPDDAKTLFNVGLAYNKMLSYKEARPWLEKSLSLAEESETLCQYGLSRYRGFGEVDEALDLFRRAIDRDAGNLEARYQRGCLLADEKQRFDDALADFREVGRLDSTHFFAQRNQGICLKALRRYDEAVEALKKALALKPTATFAIRLLADTYADRGSEEDALATYDRGLKLDPENATLHNHKGVFLINRLHQPTAALRAFEEAIRLQPGVWNFRRNQSVALWSMGQPEKAIQSIDEALPRLEHKHAAYYQKGEIRLGQGRWAEAIASYRSARKEAPQWIDPCRALQHTYFQTGRYRDGVEISREAIRLAPDDLFVRMMLVCFLCASGEEEEAVRRAKLWCAGAIPTNRTMDFAYLCAIAGEAEKAREALARIAHPDAETRIFIAAIQARLGDVDAAVASVKAAAEQGYRIKEGAVLPPELEALPPDRVGDWFRRMRER